MVSAFIRQRIPDRQATMLLFGALLILLFAAADAFAHGVAKGDHGYGKGRESTGERGELVAAFDGSHGWFWRNRSGVAVTVALRTKGGYTALKRVV